MSSRDGIELWDAEAVTFDDAADHGLRDDRVRRAWRDLLVSALPPAPARVADLGCGTGTLSLLLAAEGYAVAGLDFSPRMIRRARAKAEELSGVSFVEADASDPPLHTASYEVVLCRHVLWAMPDPLLALRRWIALLVPGGRLVLIEGRWFNGAGLSAAETVALVEATGRKATVRPMPETIFWGREIDDERYLVTS